MKTANERVNEWLSENSLGITEKGFGSLVGLLKEQDKITRHACAEAIMKCEIEYSGALDKDAVSVDEAFAACINVKAV